MSASHGQGRGGLGCFSVLLIVFVTLKLTGLVPWSWWFVLAPLWVPAALAVVFLAGAGIVLALRR